eukprot:gene4943-6916_t
MMAYYTVSPKSKGSCKNGMCSDIPSNNQYYLTSFCDSSVACGSFSGNCNEYYCADYSRFGCGSIVSCCRGSDCLNLKVIDGGPGCSVEDSAKKQIVDASYSTCKHFTGSTSCGWSDKILVTCKKTSYVEADTIIEAFTKVAKIPLGPCSYNTTFASLNQVPLCGYDEGLF